MKHFKLPPQEEFLKKMFDHQGELYYEAVKYCTSKRSAIDVGGHIGLFSNKMIKDFENVYAFEPMFHSFLKENVNSEKLTIYPFGLSSKETNHNFIVKPTHTGMSRIDLSGKDTIECKTLDSFNFLNVDLLKIDVEGHEIHVLEGSKNFFKNNSPVIIIEINNKKNRKQIFNILNQYNYKEIKKINQDFLFSK